VAVARTLDAAIRNQGQEWARRRERGCREEEGMGGMVVGERLQWSVKKEGSKQQQNRETLWDGE